jgi:parvulin-like peptidyl-prolyl isomerase
MIENHVTENVLMNHVKNHLIIKKFIHDNIKKEIEIPDDKLLEFYQENINAFECEDTVRISHILVEDFDPQALEKITQMRKEINTPESFFKKVRECSECPTCCQSGDLGYFVKGELIPELDEVVFNMNHHEISQPIKSKYGYHIVIITDKRKHNKTPFDKIKNALKEQLIEIEAELKLVKLLRELKEKSNIEIYIEI